MNANDVLELFVIAVLIMTPVTLVGIWTCKLMGWVKVKSGGAV